MFDYNQVEYQSRKKQAEEMRKAQERDSQQREASKKMKEVLEEQIRIQNRKKE